MSVTVYQCTSCNREIQVARNKRSVEVIHNCVITQNCRGTMYPVKNLDDYTRGKTPDVVPGLEDWNQRNVLFNFAQNVESDVWTIVHNLKAFPEVFVFVDQPTEADPSNRTQIEPLDVETRNENTLVVTLSRPWTGVAQLVVSTSFPGNRSFEVVTTPITNIQLSNNGELTIALPRPEVHSTNVTIGGRWVFAAGTTLDTEFVVDDVQSINSPWRSFSMVEMHGHTFELRSFIVRNFNIPAGSHLQFLSYDGNPIGPSSMMIMAARPPFEIFDVDKTRVVDVNSIKNDTLALAYDGFELSTTSEKLKSVFPLMVGI